MGATVEMRNVVKCFGNTPPIEVLRGVNLHVESGESVAIIGPSGSGKTTLLQLLGGLDHPDSGSISMNDCQLETLGEKACNQLRNRQIGFVFQMHHLLPQLTVLENVLVPTWASGHSPEATERATRLLKRVGLDARCEHRPGQLSGGERQRVALVRALMMQPGLLLADEPTGSLDHSNSQRLTNLLMELNRDEKVTLVTVTHSMDLAQKHQRQLVLQDGNLKPL